MFAVKGWKLDASAPKPQTETIKGAQLGNGKQSRKRKRENAESAKETAQQDQVGKLWEEHIERKQPVKRLKQLQNERKRQKPASEGANNGVNGGETSTNGPGHAQQSEGGSEKQAKKKDKKSMKQKYNGRLETTESSPPAKEGSTAAASAAVPAKPSPMPAGGKLTPMQAAMRQKLISARFRHLNETLYTEQSSKALELFEQNPGMFEDYHSGFRQQVSVWPENPVDNFIATIRSRGKVRLQSQNKAFRAKKKQTAAQQESVLDDKPNALPRTHGTSIIADLGCGDARLAQTLKESGDGQKLQLKVLSYDLHSPSSLVTKADISNIPTPDGTVDIAIFCLALMGTNWISFVEEAYRILHWKGELWVAEIKSRFGRVGRTGKPVEHSVGGKRKQAAIQKAQEKKKQEQQVVNEQETLAVVVDGAETQNVETDVSAFVDVLKRRGFLLKNGEHSIDLSNKMFVKMEFVKAAAPTKGKNKPADRVKPEQRFKKAKFLDQQNQEDPATDDEARTLKPCVYKAR